MSKRKKSREQKVIADLRRKLQSSESLPSHRKDLTTVSISLSQEKIPVKSDGKTYQNAYTNTYPYLLHDLSKTGILTGAIIIAQIFLFFLLKNHVVTLPMVRY